MVESEPKARQTKVGEQIAFYVEISDFTWIRQKKPHCVRHSTFSNQQIAFKYYYSNY